MLRDAVDAHLTGSRHTHAVAPLAELAERYALAVDTVTRLAADLRIPLSPNESVQRSHGRDGRGIRCRYSLGCPGVRWVELLTGCPGAGHSHRQHDDRG
jgi:hypothetical protein